MQSNLTLKDMSVESPADSCSAVIKLSVKVWMPRSSGSFAEEGISIILYNSSAVVYINVT